MNRSHLRSFWCLVAGALLATTACSSFGPRDYYEKRDRDIESASHTSGEALEQRKLLMRRAHRDLAHVQTTLESLRRHRYLDDIAAFEEFVRPYLEERVDPLFSDRDASWHTELVPLDANLLFAKAAVLAELRDRGGVDDVIREIEKRFEGLDSLVVEYPIGNQQPLEAGLLDLRRRRYRL